MACFIFMSNLKMIQADQFAFQKYMSIYFPFYAPYILSVIVFRRIIEYNPTGNVYKNSVCQREKIVLIRGAVEEILKGAEMPSF